MKPPKWLFLSTDSIMKLNTEQLQKATMELQSYARGYKKMELEKIKEKDIPLPNIYRKYTSPTNKKETHELSRLNFKLNRKFMSTLETKTQTRNYLLSEFFRTKSFLESETSSLSGWENTIRRFVDTIKRKTQSDFNFDDIASDKSLYKKLFELYNELNAQDVEWRMLDSAQSLKTLSEYVVKNKDKSINKMIKELRHNAKDIYIKQKEKERQKIPTSNLDLDLDTTLGLDKI